MALDGFFAWRFVVVMVSLIDVFGFVPYEYDLVLFI